MVAFIESESVTSRPRRRTSARAHGLAHPETRGPARGSRVSGRRYLQTETGRWVSRDPIGEDGGSNVYAFLRGQVVGRSDWLGLLENFTRTSNRRHWTACTSPGDTEQSIAGYLSHLSQGPIFMDSSKALGINGWLRDRDGNPLNTIGAGMVVTGPNTVHATYGDLGLTFGGLGDPEPGVLGAMDKKLASLKKAGWFIEDHRDTRRGRIGHESILIKRWLNDKRIGVWLHGGHGSVEFFQERSYLADGEISYTYGDRTGSIVLADRRPAPPNSASNPLYVHYYDWGPTDFLGAVHHPLSLVYLYSCSAGKNQGWMDLLAPGGWFFAPEQDLWGQTIEHDLLNLPGRQHR